MCNGVYYRHTPYQLFIIAGGKIFPGGGGGGGGGGAGKITAVKYTHFSIHKHTHESWAANYSNLHLFLPLRILMFEEKRKAKELPKGPPPKRSIADLP